MKTRIKKVGFVLLCLLIFGSQHKVSADAQSAKVEFQVEQKINGVEPSTMKYCYELQALEEMNPMPSGLQVRYIRFGKLFAPRRQAFSVSNTSSENCVASSKKMMSYSCP